MSLQGDGIMYVRESITTQLLSDVDDESTESSLHEHVLNQAHDETEANVGITWYSAVFLVVNAALGAGLLNFPQAFGQAGGVLVAITVQMALLLFIILALIILAYCSDAEGSKTYQDVVASVCGKRANQICSFVVALYCYGTCITFVIIIGDQFDRVFSSLYGTDFCHKWFMNRYFTISLSCTILILPMCFPKKIDFLKYTSFFGVLAVFYIEFVIVYQYYKGGFIAGPIKTRPDTWTDVFLVIPVICFGYQCHVSCVPIYSCLKDRLLRTFLRTVLLAIAICAFTYSLAATYGYITFGSLVQSDVLSLYNAKDPIVLIGIIALALKIFSTYPILLFCGRAAVNDLYLEIKNTNEIDAQTSERTRRFVIAFVWFFTSIIFALFIPNISDVIEYLGSLAAIFIFVFPGLCLLKLTLRNDPYFIKRSSQIKVAISCAFLVMGFFLFGLVIAQSISEDMKPVKSAEIKLCI